MSLQIQPKISPPVCVEDGSISGDHEALEVSKDSRIGVDGFRGEAPGLHVGYVDGDEVGHLRITHPLAQSSPLFLVCISLRLALQLPDIVLAINECDSHPLAYQLL